MEKIKNFFYDKNDLLIALIVVIAALFIITNRVEAIMAYPQHLAQIQAEKSEEEADSNQVAPPSNADEFKPGKDTTGAALAASEENASGPAVSSDADSSSSDAASKDDKKPADSGAASGSGQAPAATPAPSSLYIQNGDSWATVATKLLNAGLVSSKEDFMSAVNASHKENRLQVGNFTIPSGSTPAQIVAIITR